MTQTVSSASDIGWWPPARSMMESRRKPESERTGEKVALVVGTAMDDRFGPCARIVSGSTGSLADEVKLAADAAHGEVGVV